MLLQNKERQEIAQIGKQELLDRLLEKFPIEQATTTLGPGHDAAVISPTEPHVLTASKLMDPRRAVHRRQAGERRCAERA